MEAKKYILLLYFIVNVSSFAHISPINVQQKMEILDRRSQLQALEIQLLQQELTDLREVTRNLQNSPTNKDDTSAAIVDQPKDISDHAHAEQNWKYQVLKALKYEKMARFSMEERINRLVNLLEQKNQDIVNLLEQKNQDMGNLLEQKNQDMVNLLEQKNQDNLNKLAEMKAGLSSVNNIQEKQKADNLKMFTEMKAGLSSVNNIQEKLKDQLNNLTARFMEPKCTHTLAEINRSENNCMIAFYACATKSIAHLDPYETIVFDRVETNHGNAYSKTNGIFTSPRHGVYVFYVHIIGSLNKVVRVCLKKNDKCIIELYTEPSGAYSSDDNMAVVDLAKGDHVYAVKYGYSGKAKFGAEIFWTNFAGFMLYPL